MSWRRHTSDGGAAIYTRADGFVHENVIRGHMDPSTPGIIIRELDALEAEHGQFVVLHYWMDAPTYDPETRKIWMDWLRRKNGTMKEVHAATTSTLVKMGLAVANIAYSHTKFIVHTTDASYLAARRKLMSDVPFPPK